MAEDVAACIRGLPSKIKIGPYDWSISIEDVGNDLCGSAMFETNTIKLWPAMLANPSHVVGTVLHECLHIIFDNHHLDKLHGKKDAREETIISGFESGLISLFRDNPKLFTWLKKWLK